MTGQRWTIRGITRTTVENVQRVQRLTGLPLGIIVDRAIANGLHAAKEQLVGQICQESSNRGQSEILRKHILDVDRILETITYWFEPRR